MSNYISRNAEQMFWCFGIDTYSLCQNDRNTVLYQAAATNRDILKGILNLICSLG